MARQGLATIGLKVEINDSELNFVTEIGDIGGTPSDLDVTCMKDTMRHTIGGVKDAGAFDITILYDNSDETSDYRVARALEEAKTVVPVKVTFPDGTVFSTTALIYTMVNGAKVDDLFVSKIACKLQSDWVVTNPTA